MRTKPYAPKPVLIALYRLHQVTDNYQRFLSKKKDLEALPEEPDKLSARDALGIVMISHGDELGSTSAFGSPLMPYCDLAY